MKSYFYFLIHSKPDGSSGLRIFAPLFVYHVKTCLLFGALLSGIPFVSWSSELLYRTTFEQSEGFFPTSNLNGVNGWIASSDGGTGIPDDNFFPGLGQHAFVGFAPFENLSEENFSLFLWHPVNYIPRSANNLGSVVYKVKFRIFDSTNDARDDFRWAFFNTENKRLFTLDFDNSALRINYILGSTTNFVPTRATFDNQTMYDLEVKLDFQNNKWSASLNGQVFIQDIRLLETGRLPSLSDVSVIWAVRDTTKPGDNFMLFDDYEITLDTGSNPSSNAELKIALKEDGTLALRASADSASSWSIEGSDDLKKWNFLLDVLLTEDISEWQLDSGNPQGFWRIIPKP